MDPKARNSDRTSRFHSPLLRVLMGVMRPLVGRPSPTFVFSMIVSDQGLTYYPTPGQPEFLPWNSVVRAIVKSKPSPVLEIEHVSLKQFTLAPKVLAWPIAPGAQDASDKLRMIEDRVSDRFMKGA